MWGTNRSVVRCDTRDQIGELLGKRRVCIEQLGGELVALATLRLMIQGKNRW
jgi:hypothetical protein